MFCWNKKKSKTKKIRQHKSDQIQAKQKSWKTGFNGINFYVEFSFIFLFFSFEYPDVPLTLLFVCSFFFFKGLIFFSNIFLWVMEVLIMWKRFRSKNQLLDYFLFLRSPISSQQELALITLILIQSTNLFIFLKRMSVMGILIVLRSFETVTVRISWSDLFFWRLLSSWL